MEATTAGNTTLGNNSITGKSFMEEVQDYLTFKIATDAMVTENMTAVLKDTQGNEPDDLSTFIEEVETYMTYKVASYFNLYWCPILVPIGFMGNTLSFFVMMRPNNRKVSTCIYMAAISVNDNLMMCLALHDYLVLGVQLHDMGLWECKITDFFINFCLQTGTYQVLAMTFDKYVAIKWPHKAATHSTPKRAKNLILCVFGLAVIYNIPHLLITSLVGDQCISYSVDKSVFFGNFYYKRNYSFHTINSYEFCHCSNY